MTNPCTTTGVELGVTLIKSVMNRFSVVCEFDYFTYFSSLMIHAISLVLRPFHILAATNQKLDRVKDLEMSLVTINSCDEVH